MCVQKSKTTFEQMNCGNGLYLCQQKCTNQVQSTISKASNIKTFAENSKKMQEFKIADQNDDDFVDYQEFMAIMEADKADMR